MTTHPLTLASYSVADHERDRALIRRLAEVARSGSQDIRLDALWLLLRLTTEPGVSVH